MATRLQVEGYKTLVRETVSSGIVNTDVTGYEVYMKRIKSRHESSDKIRTMVKEINTLKTELREIKSLIINGKGNKE